MRMKLIGMTTVRAGTSKKNDEDYMSIDLHFSGRSLDVEGVTVAKVYVDLMKVKNPPPFQLGSLYDVDLTDKGYLRNIELLEEANPAPGTPPQSDKKAV